MAECHNVQLKSTGPEPVYLNTDERTGYVSVWFVHSVEQPCLLVSDNGSDFMELLRFESPEDYQEYVNALDPAKFRAWTLKEDGSFVSVLKEAQ